MLSTAPLFGGSAASYLFLGAHCDDIEIGCGGTILRLAAEHPESKIRWVVFSRDSERELETRRSAERFMPNLQNFELTVLSFRNSFFPQVASDIKESFEELKQEVEPDVVFTHNRDDLHQDHRTIGQLTWNTFRDHLILEYEIPKYDGDLGSPNVFVPLSRDVLQEKATILLDEYTTQRRKKWFTEDTFFALPRIRGMECNAPDGLAEAFYCRKMYFQPF